MAADRELQSVASNPQQPQRDDHVAAPADQIDRLRRQPYLTSEEAAVYLGLPSVQAVYHRIRRGTIPSWCVGRLGRDYRFNRAALDQLQAPPVTRDARANQVVRVAVHGRRMAQPYANRPRNSVAVNPGARKELA